MKLPILVLALFSLLSPVASAESDELPHVSVFGTATTQVQPDLLRWSLSVDRVGAEVAEVADAHAADVAAVLEFLKQQKIPAKEIQTSHVELSEHREYRRDSWSRTATRRPLRFRSPRGIWGSTARCGSGFRGSPECR